MPRGLFTQTVCILLSRPTELAEIEPLLGEYEIAKRVDTAENNEMSGPALIMSLSRPAGAQRSSAPGAALGSARRQRAAFGNGAR